MAGSEWGYSSNPEAFLRFETEGKVSGFAGCNHFFGTYEIIDNESIQFGQMGATRKMCPPQIMAHEQVLFEALNKASIYRRDRYKLVLGDAQNNEILKMEQRDRD